MRGVSYGVSYIASVVLARYFTRDMSASTDVPAISLPAAIVVRHVGHASGGVLEVFCRAFTLFGVSGSGFFRGAMCSFFGVYCCVLEVVPLRTV